MGLRIRLLEHEEFLEQLKTLGRESDRLVLVAGSIGVVCELIAHVLHEDSGKFWAYVALLTAPSLFLWSKERLQNRGGDVIYRLFLMGLVTGLTELLVDWALIHWVSHGRLCYRTTEGDKLINDVVLLGSPIWMPLAWACLFTVLGYCALRVYYLLLPRLGKHLATSLASLLVSIQAFISVGMNEWLASQAGWWTYGRAAYMYPWFGSYRVPLCIPLGEFFQFLLILPICAAALKREEERPVEGTLLGGWLFGLAIAGGYGLAYLLLEFGRPLP
jgi:hypothetical protein